MTNLERFNDYIRRGYEFDYEVVLEDGEKLISRCWIIEEDFFKKGFHKTRIPHTTVYCAYTDDEDEGFDFNTLKEAKAYIKEV